MANVIPYSAEIITQAATLVSHTPIGKGETSHNRIAEVNTNTYVLQSASNAALSGKSGVPSWLANAIAASIVDGEIDIRQIITDLDTALRSLVTGVSQQISSVQTSVESNNSLVTATVSRLDDDIAGVITLANSKVTPEEASATMATFLEAEFNTPTVTANSTILNLLNTTSNATGTQALAIDALGSSFSQSNIDMQNTVDANADIVDGRFTNAGIGSDGYLIAGAYSGQTLSAAVGDVDVRLITEQGITVGNHIYNASAAASAAADVVAAQLIVDDATAVLDAAILTGGAEEIAAATQDLADANSVLKILTNTSEAVTLRIGMKRFINSSVTPDPFIAGNLEVYTGGILGWQACDERPWAAGASNMVVDPDTGALTGWNYTSGSAGSTFAIAADSFYLENSAVPGYRPFSVVGSDIQLMVH